MVAHVNSHQGLHRWLLQRLTAVVMTAYLVWMLSFALLHRPLHFDAWHAWVSQTHVRVGGSLTLCSILLHTRIGLWTIWTDYIKSYVLRMILQATLLLLLTAYLFWGLKMIWGA